MNIVSATITGSLILNGVNISSITGSESSINALNSFTASAATTGSNQFNGNQTVTGSVNITGSLIVTGSIIGTVTTASYVLNAVSASYALVATTSSYALVATSASYALNTTTSSYALVATSASYAANTDLLDGRDSLTFANTGSNNFVGTQNINGAVAITGSLTTTGAITAQTLNVQQVTSSIVYSSGSNIFGNSISNTQSMTGSVGISGSLAVTGAATISSSVTATSFSNAGLYSGEVFNGTKSNAGAYVGYLQNTSATGLGLYIQNGSDTLDALRIGNASGSANNIQLFGSGKAYFAGNVGIGTESPTALLNTYSATTATQIIVTGADTTNQRLEVTDGTVTNRFGIFGRTNGDAGVIGTQTNHALVFNTNNTERMRITSDGNFLVGAINADVGGSVKGAIIRQNGSIVGATNISSPLHYQSPITADRMNTMGDGLMYGMWRQGIFQAGIGATNASVMTFFTGNNDSMTERMRITSGGNVLIGVTTGTALLEVKQPTLAIGSIFQAWAPGVGGAAFRVISTTGQPYMQYDFNNGNVGIGATNPLGKLTTFGGAVQFIGDYDNHHTIIKSTGNQGTFNGSLVITIPEMSTASGDGYGGFSCEVYVAGYSGMYCHVWFSGYINGGITASEAAILRSNGGWSVSQATSGTYNQGFTFTIDYPNSLIHPTARIIFNKGGNLSATAYPANSITAVWS